MTSLSLPRSTPAKHGVQSSKISSFIDRVNYEGLGLHSLMIMRHGEVIAEGWWNPYSATQPHLLYSLSKSFTSTAAGIAIAEGRFGLDDLVVDLFPNDLPDTVSDNLAKLKVRHLLSMSTGHTTDTVPVGGTSDDSNWEKAILSKPIEHEPGTFFYYNNGATYLAGSLVQRHSGMRLIDYLRPRLFDPLGIEPARWHQSPAGLDVGFSGLYITTEDIAKFGHLYLREGIWDIAGNDQRLLTREWVKEATSIQISNGDDPNSDWAQGYGFQFWRCRHELYRGDGAFGQFCIVFPQHDAVVAMTSGSPDIGALMTAAWDTLLPSFNLPASEIYTGTADQELAEQLQIQSVPLNRYVSAPDSSDLRSFNGTYVAPEGIEIPYNISEIEVAFPNGGSGSTIKIVRPEIVENFEFKQGGWFDSVSNMPEIHKPYPAKIRAYWTGKTSYETVICCVDSPYTVMFTFEFEDGHANITIAQNVSFGGSLSSTFKFAIKS